MKKLDAAEIRHAARGQWVRILESVCGLDSRKLNPKIHGPCPQCGGTDRFRALDDVAESGALFCNQCHNGDTLPKSGDGLSSVQWLLGCGFSEALRQVAAEVGKMPRTSVGEPKTAAGTGGAKIHATTEAAADALAWGMTQNDILTEQRKSDSGWRYRNADGSDAGAVLRWDLPNGRKEIRQVSAVTGGWICRAIPEPRPLYRLPQMLAADAAEIVWIVEGEKAADVGPTLGLCCVTSSGGSNAAEKTDWKPVQGRRVVIVPDNDEPGEKYAADVARQCHAAGAVSVAVLRLPTIWPQCPVGGDLADFSEAFDSRTADELRAMLEDAAVESVGVGDDDETPSDTEPESADGLQIFDGWHAAFNPRPHKPVIIEGMLRLGEVSNVIAATKAGKSWFAVQLLQNVATGKEWLGRRVAKGRCLLIDNELQPETLENRLAAVRAALRIDEVTERSPLDYMALRGNWKSLTDLAAKLPLRYQPGDLKLIVLDAKYRFFSGDGMEENSNDAQTVFHNAIDKLAADLDCGVLMVHHATKGDQSGKSVVDMGAGGGAQARAADLHCVLRDHELPGHAVLQAAVRSFPPVEPQTLRYDWPLWSVVSGVSPQVANPKKRGDTDGMRKKIETHLKDEWQSLSSLADRCGTKAGRAMFMDIIESMQGNGLLELRGDFKPPRSTTTCKGVRRTGDSSLGTVSADSI